MGMLQQVEELNDTPTPADLFRPEGAKLKIVLSKKGEVEITGNRLGLKTLPAAEEKFRTFLATQSYPKAICWLMPGDVVVDTKRHYWVRKREAEGTRYAAVRYSDGLQRNFGIMLKAICATEMETFASVFIPSDELDAEGYLIGRGLKLSCPIERYSTTAVRNPLKWKVLCWRNGQRSKLLEP